MPDCHSGPDYHRYHTRNGVKQVTVTAWNTRPNGCRRPACFGKSCSGFCGREVGGIQKCIQKGSEGALTVSERKIMCADMRALLIENRKY